MGTDATMGPTFTRPMLLHLTASYYLLVACTSFAAFLLRVACTTSPRMFAVFAVACSSPPIVLVGFLAFNLFLARRPLASCQEAHDIEANDETE